MREYKKYIPIDSNLINIIMMQDVLKDEDRAHRRKIYKALFFLIFLGLIYFLFMKLVFIAKFDHQGAIHEVVARLIQDTTVPTAKTVIIGDSSMSAGVMPSVISERTYNLSVWAADSRLVKVILERYMQQRKQVPACLVVGLNFTHRLRYEDKLFYQVLLFHDLYTWSEILGIYFESYQNNFFPARDDNFIKYLGLSLASKLKFYGVRVDNLQRIFVPDRNNKTSLTDYKKLVFKARGYSFLGTNGELSEENFGRMSSYFSNGFEAERTHDFYLNSIIELAKAKNIKLFFAVPPTFDNEKFNSLKTYRSGFLAYLDQKKVQYPEFEVIDVNFNLKEKKFFHNVNHLNQKGAFEYSRALKDSLPSYCTE